MSKKNNKTRGRKKDMLKELVRRKEDCDNSQKKVSPVEQALKRFKMDNGYDFLDMVNDEKIRKRHQFKQMQKKEYDDNEFLETFQNNQGE
ncbi:hypothetical protein [Halalkalibacterium ligniniphilum]|uniref:hypothetical protein n=1 Tax=Halalkalibacterium ligniniphilum TaxID=1134413 RepID=UPI000365DED4|nr:hypothetical protein [Halalkalibacterium ligniniphilum]